MFKTRGWHFEQFKKKLQYWQRQAFPKCCYAIDNFGLKQYLMGANFFWNMKFVII